MDKIISFYKQNTKLCRICSIILLVILISCIIPIRGCVNKNSAAQEYYHSAVAEKTAGEYVSAYNYCRSALEIKPKMKKALKLMEELTPLKEQQEAEEQAKIEAEQAAVEAKKQEAIQTLLNNHAFDGELAVKILKEYTEINSGEFMYGDKSYDATGNYFPVLHRYSSDSEYWDKWLVYETGEVQSQDSVSNSQGYTVSAESTIKSTPKPEYTSAPANTPTPKPANTPAPTNKPETTKSQNTALDKTYHGDGYQISYPGSFEKSEMGGILMLLDPDSGCNVTVTVAYEVGDIDGLTKQDMTDMLSAVGINVNIDTFYDTAIDGYKCYVAEYDTGDCMQTFFILGDGTDTYSLVCTYTSDANDNIMNTIIDIVYSFDLT